MCGIVLCFNKSQQQICVWAISVKGALPPQPPCVCPCSQVWKHGLANRFLEHPTVLNFLDQIMNAALTCYTALVTQQYQIILRTHS